MVHPSPRQSSSERPVSAPDPLTVEQQALQRRLEAYSPDTPGVPMPYSRRLAEREGWSHAHAMAVIAEYKRFAYLAVSSGHVATPSKAIDAAWHLHLEYTREYWDVFCVEVLCAPLHHTPGNGAPDEAAAYARLYEQTLDSYRRAFGSEPPATIWPRPSTNRVQHETAPGNAPSHARGEEGLAQRLKRRWTALRPRRARFAWLAWLSGAVATCAYAQELNVLNYAGPQFLQFYLLLCTGVLLLIFAMQRITYHRHAWGICRNQPAPRELPPDEVAFLAGGAARMAHVATLALVESEAIRFTPIASRHPYVTVKDSFKGGRFVDECEWLRRRKDGRANYTTFRARLMMREPALSRDLCAEGWLWAPHSMRKLRFIAHALALLTLGTGCAKTIVGLNRDRPITFLVMAMVLFLAAYLLLTVRLPGLGGRGLTKAGRTALDAQRARYANREPGRDAPLWKLAFAGVVALQGTSWSIYANALEEPSPAISSSSQFDASTDSSSSSSSNCSSSGCGGCSN